MMSMTSGVSIVDSEQVNVYWVIMVFSYLKPIKIFDVMRWKKVI